MVRLESEDFIDGVKQKIAEDCGNEDARIVRKNCTCMAQ